MMRAQIAEKILTLYQSKKIAEVKTNSYQMYQRHYTEHEMLEQTQAYYLRCLA
ncbi:hypothetical protein ACWPXM_04160 [Lactiplantibacillus plantarum]